MAGSRAPSVRQLVRDRGVSPATVLRAYEVLEAAGMLDARSRSGHYVSSRWADAPAEPPASRPATRSTRLSISDLVFSMLESVRDRDALPLGSAFPDPALFPLARLGRYLAEAARRLTPDHTVQDLPPGNLELRRQIARRYLRFGTRVSADEIIITSGALEALNLSLGAVTRPGDLVAIESPTFYGCLQSVEAHGLRAMEIPTHPRTGVDLDALARVLKRHPVRACWLMPAFQNPLGARMPDEARAELLRLLTRHDVPLIEDSVYAELHYGKRPVAARAHDRRGLVLDCGSFSKSLAPGYRVGWVAAGRYARAVQRAKMSQTLATSSPVQRALAAYLADGGYDRFLRGLRRELDRRRTAALAALARYLPAGFSVTLPEGGYFLWAQLATAVDALELQRRALAQGVSLAPGPMFSARREFGNCIRLNYGHPSITEFGQGARIIGLLAHKPR